MSSFLDLPALEPPEGVIPNFENPPNQNALALGVLTACCVVSTLCVLIRAYGRIYLLKKFQIEEVLVLIAYGNFAGCAYATLSLRVTPGYFVHQWNVYMRDLIPTLYDVFIFSVCYSILMPCLKVAILLEWCRVFVPKGMHLKSWFWWGCMAVIFLQVTGSIAIVIALNLQCKPHSAIWDITLQTPGACWSIVPLTIFSATLHVVCDLAIFLLPQHLIWSLHMPWQKRLGVSGICGLGALACVAAIFRFTVTIAYGTLEDATYNVGPLAFWAMTELTCGFFIVCVPCIPRILRATGIRGKIKSTMNGGTGGSASANVGANWTNRSNNINNLGHNTKIHLALAGGESGSMGTNSDKLSGDQVPLRNLHHSSESTEWLYHENHRIPNTSGNITRTTKVTVEYA
ncbi:hypothetical protein AJ80_05073 [Polytolypa hystricis UAMH7299]|uniref:Rhodopsin domain-containing protein n=1 Tax=Polytolypa hystricis (strain UAMH7299) TaxID=1447883 RepID=A0A2B7Y761_POLH7|nr:hypothetical protein AJ80_05073 [Polytolypa hystricis UAMH7299]